MMSLSRSMHVVGLLAGVSSLAACGLMAPSGAVKMPTAVQAATHLSARSNTKVSGTVELRQEGAHVVVKTLVTGLNPNGLHGFHIHETGDCNSPDASTAGGHFNPTGKPHGPQDAAHHAGDMPMLKADMFGRAEAEFHLTDVTLLDGPNSVIGRSIIVHRDPDDFKTQPTGNSGARVACGVIQRL